MKKLLKILAVCSAATVAACLTACGDKPHDHTYSSEWTPGEITHWHESTCEHIGLRDAESPHVDDDGDGTCDVCGAPAYYGRLVISNVNSLEVGSSRDLDPRFTDPDFAGTVTYKFDGDAIKIEGNIVTALKSGATVSVTATTAYHSKTFTVTTVEVSTVVDFGTVAAYVGYAPSPLLLDGIAPNASVTFTYDNTKMRIDSAARTVTALQDGTFTVYVKSGSTDGTLTVDCSTVDRSDTAFSARKYRDYAETELAAAWTERGDSNSTLFIGDSFFDRRWFWNDFYTELDGKNVVNGGISESTAQEWEGEFYDVYLADTAPKNLVINLGTNNIGLGDSAYDAALKLQRMMLFMHSRQNLRNTEIYWFSITPRGDSDGAGKDGIIRSVNASMKKWCDAFDWVTYVEVYDKIDISTHLRDDKLHPLATTYGSVYLPALYAAGLEIENK